MPANFLIVCGGVGRGILHQFDKLGFDGALQIDVQSELVHMNDGRILILGLPIAPVHEPTPNSVACIADYLKRLEAEWQSSHRDSCHNGEYHDCTTGDCANFRSQVNHVKSIDLSQVAANVRDSIAQTPVIGRSYITREIVSHVLLEKIQQMMHYKPANENLVTVWLVSSTCGGTGNGIVHHVADLVMQEFAYLNLKIKFVRIGAVTYRSIVPSADIATFWAVLTDFWYRNELIKKAETLDAQGMVYRIPPEYYYIDLPDVGVDTKGREDLVESSFRLMANPVLEMNIHIRSMNSNGVIMVRVGEWNNPWSNDTVYQLTLRQLKQKLDMLLQPPESLLMSHVIGINFFDPIELVNEVNQQLYVTFAQSNTIQPVLRTLVRVRDELNSCASLEMLRMHPRFSMMQQLVQLIFDERQQGVFRRQVQVSLIIDNETELLNIGADLNNSDNYIGSEAHIKMIRIAQYAKAQAKHFLLGDGGAPGYVMTELREAWDGLIPRGPVGFEGLGRLLVTDEQRRVAFLDGIPRFLQAYFRVVRLLDISNEATIVINRACTTFENLTNAVTQQIAMTPDNSKIEYTYSAALEETFGGNASWLQMLTTSHWVKYYDTGSLDQLLVFQKIVALGAIGFTLEGIRSVLEAPKDAGIDQIVHLINSNSRARNLLWWQGIEQPRLWGGPHGVSFDCRVFPKLLDDVRESFWKENDEWGIRHHFAPLQYLELQSIALDLKIYTVQCVGVSDYREEQIRELIYLMLHKFETNHSHYVHNNQFSLQLYTTVQCKNSIGLPIRVPSALMNDPAIKDIMTIMADYLVIDQS